MTLREVPDSVGEFEWLCLYGFCSGAVTFVKTIFALIGNN